MFHCYEALATTINLSLNTETTYTIFQKFLNNTADECHPNEDFQGPMKMFLQFSFSSFFEMVFLFKQISYYHNLFLHLAASIQI